MTENHKPEREFTRVSTQFCITVAAGEKTLQSGRTQDLSMNGVYVVCDDALPVGAECSISIRLSENEGGPAITATGKAIRTGNDPSGFAMEFTEIDLESYEHLRQLVMLNSQDPDKVEKELNQHLGLKRP